jgi:hypothetical protein
MDVEDRTRTNRTTILIALRYKLVDQLPVEGKDAFNGSSEKK